VGTSAHYLGARQVATPTSTPAQASANNALCATPSPGEDPADAALTRGVPFFLNEILTLDFLPNNGALGMGKSFYSKMKSLLSRDSHS
jgi:hypothetical protein